MTDRMIPNGSAWATFSSWRGSLLEAIPSLVYLDLMMTNTSTHQVADYRKLTDDLPPCFCIKEEEHCKGDCPYCRIGGFALHGLWEAP
jgi:hypothetical protein